VKLTLAPSVTLCDVGCVVIVGTVAVELLSESLLPPHPETKLASANQTMNRKRVVMKSPLSGTEDTMGRPARNGVGFFARRGSRTMQTALLATHQRTPGDVDARIALHRCQDITEV
jgi:hypothetical protein